jgi:hypothetical protein
MHFKYRTRARLPPFPGIRLLLLRFSSKQRCQRPPAALAAGVSRAVLMAPLGIIESRQAGLSLGEGKTNRHKWLVWKSSASAMVKH